MRQKKFTLLILLPTIVILSIGGCFGYKYLQNNKNIDLKMYQTDIFSLKYSDSLVAIPSGQILSLYIKGCTPSDSETFVPYIFIGKTYALPNNFTDLTSWAKLNSEFSNISEDSEIQIGDNNFTIFTADSGPSAYSIHYLIYNKDNIYDFGIRIVGTHEKEAQQLQKYLPQILTTLKFTE